MVIAVITGWVARALVILLSLLNTRLLIELIGVEGLAAHAVILSLSVWFALLNLGLPISVQNLISKYRAQGRDCEVLKNTSFSAMVILFLIFLPLVLLAGYAVKSWLLVNFQFAGTLAVLAACVGIFLSGLGSVFNQILYAEHRGIWPNVYPAINAVGIALILLLLKNFYITDFNVVLVVYFLPSVAIFILGVFQSRAFLEWKLNTAILREIWQGSAGLLVFAALSACTLAVDYFVMSRLLGAHDIAKYNLTSRLFGTILTIHAILLATAWPVVSELMHGDKSQAARHKVVLVLRQGLTLGVLSGGVLILIMPWVITILTGGKVGEIPVVISLAWFGYNLLRIWCDTFAMGLLCVGKTDVINRYIPFQAAISIFGQYLLGSAFGLVGVMAGLILSFITTAAWILPWQFFKLTQEKK